MGEETAKVRVLLVDHNEDLHKIYKSAFDYKYHFLSVFDLPSALSYVKENQFDILVTDTFEYDAPFTTNDLIARGFTPNEITWLFSKFHNPYGAQTLIDLVKNEKPDVCIILMSNQFQDSEIINHINGFDLFYEKGAHIDDKSHFLDHYLDQLISQHDIKPS